MNLYVNQSNLYLLLPSKVAWLTDMLMEDKNISLVDAIEKIYLLETYRQLEIETTKMWHLGPVALYQEMNNVAIEDEDSYNTAYPWIHTDINFDKIKSLTSNIDCIFSDSDSDGISTRHQAARERCRAFGHYL